MTFCTLGNMKFTFVSNSVIIAEKKILKIQVSHEAKNLKSSIFFFFSLIFVTLYEFINSLLLLYKHLSLYTAIFGQCFLILSLYWSSRTKTNYFAQNEMFVILKYFFFTYLTSDYPFNFSLSLCSLHSRLP